MSSHEVRVPGVHRQVEPLSLKKTPGEPALVTEALPLVGADPARLVDSRPADAVPMLSSRTMSGPRTRPRAT
jgi:hypothetical protein